MDVNNDFELVKQGAEAKLFRGMYLGKRTIVKERLRKNYRQADLCKHLTKERMRAEVRSIARCKTAGIRTPTLYLVDFERQRIYMEDIEGGVTLKQHVMQLCEADATEQLETVAQEIGRVVGKLHANQIIHGDLTTSNILCLPDTGKLVLIDFGLSHVKNSIEDKAVDLYVLERALITTHPELQHLLETIMNAYTCENNKEGKKVINKLEEVCSRGRKRTMVG
ncbi:hypothetical protein L9F63_021914 [Diploptera punctata]|uniref:non-specific serine/threonine protein kinase n=1 Tax=Diploptera punctata TaxID=6984 RepID=A0AAD8EBB3_DIPPU|nr:hypothetical protein L9F63_021914 [Diploptera punctata]